MNLRYASAHVALAMILLAAAVSACALGARVVEGATGLPGHVGARIATTPIDTGELAEDSQPRYTRRLARAGWDFNPNCDGRHDWFPVGHRCHTGYVQYPSGARVGG